MDVQTKESVPEYRRRVLQVKDVVPRNGSVGPTKIERAVEGGPQKLIGGKDRGVERVHRMRRLSTVQMREGRKIERVSRTLGYKKCLKVNRRVLRTPI